LNKINVIRIKILFTTFFPILVYSSELTYYSNIKLSHTRTDSEYSSNRTSIYSDVSIPIKNYFGTSFLGSVTTSEMSKSVGLRAGAYLNNSKIGAISVRYLFSRSFNDSSPNIDNNEISLYGAYYYKIFNFTVSRSKYSASGDGINIPDYNSAIVGMSVFLNEDVLISINHGLLDADELIGVGVGYLPKFIGHKTLFKTALYKQPSGNNTIQLGVSYYFGKQQSLLYHKRNEFN